MKGSSFQPGPSRNQARVGDVLLNRYHLDSRLGEGSLGTVFRARDMAKDSQPVALKLVRPEMISPEGTALLRHEFSFLTRLRHPHVAEVYDLDLIPDDQGHPAVFFTMELLRGVDVVTATADAGWDQIIGIVVQICRGLEYIHAHGLVHHDLKPPNIFVVPPASSITHDAIGYAKIVDLHLAREVDTEQLRGLRGTAAYMAPEVVTGSVVDSRADLYSLGAVLHEVISRRPLFELTDAFEILRAHLHRKPLPLRELRPDIPPTLAAVVARLLEKDPARRFRCANDVIRAINQGLDQRHDLETAATRESRIRGARLVARDNELASLEAFLAAATQRREDISDQAATTQPHHTAKGQVRAILALGQGGIGKTRLVREFRWRAQLRGTPVFESQWLDHACPPFQVFSDIVCQLRRRDDGLTDIVDTTLSPESDDPEGRRASRLRQAAELADVLIQTSTSSPFTAVIEDLHHADEGSLALLRFLVRNSHRLHALLVLTAREDELEGDAAETVALLELDPAVEVIRPAPLVPAEVRELLASMLACEPQGIPLPFAESISEVTGGNPLFIEETVKSLVEQDLLVATDGSLAPPRDPLATVTPAITVKEAIGERLTRLDSASRALINAASMSAIPTSLIDLAQQADLDLSDAAEAAVRLERRGLLERVGGIAAGSKVQPHWRPAHAAITEATYDTLSDERRRILHARTAGALETRRRDAASEGQLEQSRNLGTEMARHLAAAGQPERALPFLMEAMDHAEQRFERQHAVGLAEQALKIIDRLGPAHELSSRRLETCTRLAQALMEIGELDRSLSTLELALAGTPTNTSTVDRARAMRVLAQGRLRRGSLQTAEEAVIAGIGFAPGGNSCQDQDLLLEHARLLAARTQIALWRSDYPACDEAGRAALTALESADASHETAPVLHALHHGAFFRGEAARARSWLDRSLAVSSRNQRRTIDLAVRLGIPEEDLLDHTSARAAVASTSTTASSAMAQTLKSGGSERLRRRVGDAGGVTIYFTNLGTAHALFSHGEGLLQYYQRKLLLLEACRDLEGRAWAENNLANLQRLRGEHGAALAGYHRVLDLHRTQGAGVGMALALVNLGQVLTDLGATEAARDAAREGAAMAERCDARWLQAWGLHAQGLALLRSDRPDHALGCMRRAQSHFEAIENRVALQDTVTDRIDALLQAERRDEAESLLDEALSSAQKALQPTKSPQNQPLPPAAAAHARNAALAIEVHLHRGELEAADKMAAIALEASAEACCAEIDWMVTAAASRAKQALGETRAAMELATESMSLLRRISRNVPAKFVDCYLADPRRRAVKKLFAALRVESAAGNLDPKSEGMPCQTTTSSTDSTS